MSAYNMGGRERIPGISVASQEEALSTGKAIGTPWTVAHQALLSMEFSRQEYWSGLPFPSPGDLPETGIEPRSPALLADSLPAEPSGKSLLFYDHCQLIQK